MIEFALNAIETEGSGDGDGDDDGPDCDDGGHCCVSISKSECCEIFVLGSVHSLSSFIPNTVSFGATVQNVTL